VNSSNQPLILGTRLALRPKEAAKALGICERTLRAMLPRLPVLREGKAVMILIKPLEELLAAEAKENMENADRIAGEILEVMTGDQ
jgi:hypothetical protein